MQRFKIVFLLYVAIALFIGSAILHPTNFMESLRLKTEDSLLTIRHALGQSSKAPDGVVIVAIDNRSVHQIGRWPWDRTILARLIDQLHSAKLVAVDIVFAEPQNPQADTILAKAISNHGRVIAGFFSRNDTNITLSAEALDELSISEYRGYTLSGDGLGVSSMPALDVNVPPILSSPLASAPFNASPDRDGLYRNYPIGSLYHGLFFCNLALQSWRYATQKEITMTISPQRIETLSEGNRTFTPINGQALALNYYDNSSIKVISAIDILEGRNLEAIKDKVVFLGVTEMGIYDMRPTPVSSVTPGTWLHYTAYGNMIDGSFLRQIPNASMIGSGLLGLVAFGLFWFSRFRYRFYAYLSLSIGWFAISIWFYLTQQTLIPLFYPLVTLLSAIIANESIAHIFAEARMKELRKAFSNYVSPEILELITANPDRLQLGGEKKEITILFSDIRNFTSLSETMSPDKLLALLNEFLGPMTEEVLKHGGMLDKYIGDAIMALYNVPLDQHNHEDAAASSALALMDVLYSINQKLNLDLDIGIGIHTGHAVIGNVGSQSRFDYTAVGDSVNLASRLEGLTKMYNAHIIISENTAVNLSSQFVTRPLDKVKVKGKNNAVLIYELLKATKENKSIAEKFSKGLDCYFEGDFNNASEIFESLLPDGPSSVFLERCKLLSQNPIAIWDGVWTMEQK